MELVLNDSGVASKYCGLSGNRRECADIAVYPTFPTPTMVPFELISVIRRTLDTVPQTAVSVFRIRTKSEALPLSEYAVLWAEFATGEGARPG